MLKIFSLFSGIGAFEKALKNIGESFEIVNYCEIDKYASKAFSLIHNIDENLNLGDITKINTDKLPDDIDVITYGFPCQDISNAGKQKGFMDENGDLTRSGLFYEALRMIEDTQPKIAICENVKALTSKKFKVEFKIVLDSLNAAGYKNYWSVLNVKDYGIPQNRERVFIVSIREDIDHGFQFPEKFELTLRLKDLLEDVVDGKYYLTKEQIKKLSNNIFHQANTRLQEKDYSDTLLGRDYKDPKCIKIGNIYRENVGGNYAGNVYDINGLCPTINSSQGGNRQPMVIEKTKGINIKNATKKGYIEACEGDYINLQFPDSKTRRGRVINGVSGTLQCNDSSGVVTNELSIRKLTPKEYFRLMGFDDTDVDILIDNDISNTQLYKLAGNSIVVDVLEEIFVSLLNQYNEVFPIC